MTCPVCNENMANKRHLNPHFKIAHPVDGACCVECLQASTYHSSTVWRRSFLICSKVTQFKKQLTGFDQTFKGDGCWVVERAHKQNAPVFGRNWGTPLSWLWKEVPVPLWTWNSYSDTGKKHDFFELPWTWNKTNRCSFQHMGMVEEIPAEQELMCHECGKVFNTRKKLKHHLSNTHKSRDHPCQLCSKIFCHKHQVKNCHWRYHPELNLLIYHQHSSSQSTCWRIQK